MVKMNPDEVIQECSDDEEYKIGIEAGNFWSPSVEEVAEMYEKLTASKFLEMSWKCPGRNAPNDEKASQEVATEPVAKEEEPEAKTEFDNFDDDDKPTLRPTLKSTPKGSAKKKTANFGSILTNMERTGYMKELASEGRTLLLQPPKTITSTPDSISQSIDRVLGNKVAMEQSSSKDEPLETTTQDTEKSSPPSVSEATPTTATATDTVETESTPAAIMSSVEPEPPSEQTEPQVVSPTTAVSTNSTESDITERNETAPMEDSSINLSN